MAIAAYLRLYGLDHSQVQGDQSILLNIAMRFVNTGQLPLAANKSSAGIMNPPLISHLLAIPLFIETSLSAVHLFQGLLGLLAVAALFIYAQRLFGWRVSLLATLLLAVNPWAVYYSRFIWNPNPIPFIATLLLMSLIAYFAGNRHPAHLAFVFPLLAAITQLHLSSLVLVAAVTFVLLIFWRRHWHHGAQRDWPKAVAPIAIGLGLALLLYWPFLRFERAVGFADLKAAWTALAGGSAPTGALGVGEVSINTASLLLVQELSTGDSIWQALNLPIDTIVSGTWPITLAQILFGSSLIYVIIAPIWSWYSTRLQSSDENQASWRLPSRQVALLILAIWLVVPIAFYIRHSVYLQNYYFLYIFPAPFLASAFLLDAIIEKLTRKEWPLTSVSITSPVIHAIITLPLLLLSLWQFGLFNAWFQLVDNHTITPERQVRDIEQIITSTRSILAENAGCDLTILAEGGTVERASLAVIEQFVYPTPVRFIDISRGYIKPAQCTVYMTVADTPAQAWLDKDGSLRPERIEAGAETWRFYETSGSQQNFTPLAVWQNGLALASANIDGTPAPGAQLTLNYVWQVLEDPPEGLHYHFFNHFLNEVGQIVSQDDSPAIDSLYWRVGDRLVTRFHLSLPEELAGGSYALQVGLYTWPDLTRISLTDSQKNTYFVAAFEVAER